jgi:hypothetical protein
MYHPTRQPYQAAAAASSPAVHGGALMNRIAKRISHAHLAVPTSVLEVLRPDRIEPALVVRIASRTNP